MRDRAARIAAGCGALCAVVAQARQPQWVRRPDNPQPAPVTAYDGLRRVTVAYSCCGAYLTGEWDGAQWLARPGSGPNRAASGFVFDGARGVSFLFGGSTYVGELEIALGDGWEWDGNSWSPRGGPGPSPRAHLAMAYDSARHATVLFGGTGAGWYPLLGDTWEWDGTTWAQRAATGPAQRGGHAMAYDSRRGVTVLFGGSVNGGLGDDTWEWDGAAWTERPGPGPPARSGHAMAFDSRRGVTVLFGGIGHSAMLGDTWEWDGSVWIQRTGPGPSPRWSPAMAYDQARETMVLVGGYPDGPDPNHETWELTGCYANCDGSTGAPALTAADFTCFLVRFAAGDPFANCDASTTPPELNVLDFACFLNRFATGCN